MSLVAGSKAAALNQLSPGGAPADVSSGDTARSRAAAADPGADALLDNAFEGLPRSSAFPSTRAFLSTRSHAINRTTCSRPMANVWARIVPPWGAQEMRLPAELAQCRGLRFYSC